MNTVEQNIEANLSPRCQDSIAWDNNHVGGYVKPTHKPMRTDDDSRHNISTDDMVELVDFDINAAMRNMTNSGKTATFN